MNNRIRELAEQAGFVFWSDESWKPKGAVIDWASNYDEPFAKFLELLKNECSGIAMTQCLAWSNEGYNELDDYERGKSDAASMISGDIHQFFGKA